MTREVLHPSESYAVELDGIIPTGCPSPTLGAISSEVEKTRTRFSKWLSAEARHIDVYPLLSSELHPSDAAAAIATPERRKRLAISLAAHLRDNNFAGVALSLHQLPPTSHLAFLAFLSELHPQLRQDGRKAIVVVGPGHGGAVFVT